MQQEKPWLNVTYPYLRDKRNIHRLQCSNFDGFMGEGMVQGGLLFFVICAEFFNIYYYNFK